MDIWTIMEVLSLAGFSMLINGQFNKSHLPGLFWDSMWLFHVDAASVKLSLCYARCCWANGYWKGKALKLLYCCLSGLHLIAAHHYRQNDGICYICTHFPQPAMKHGYSFAHPPTPFLYIVKWEFQSWEPYIKAGAISSGAASRKQCCWFFPSEALLSRPPDY